MILSEYVKASRGRSGAMADRLGVSASLVIQWANGKPVAIERCAEIEKATEGCVECEQLRPDVAWHRVPDPAWPWHPDGRPLIDVGRQVVLAVQQEVRDAA